MCVEGGVGGLRERQKEEDWEQAEREDNDLGFASFSLITLSMRKLIPMLLYHAWCQATMRLNICFPIFPISIDMVASLKTMNM